MSKLLGIDYGSKRVGVALSDDSASVAFAHSSLPNDSALIPMLAALIRAENVGAVVVGDSRDKDGVENAIMKDAHIFASKLEDEMAIAVYFEPEFYSSVEARRDAGVNHVDAKAAAIILNSFIERNRSKKSA